MSSETFTFTPQDGKSHTMHLGEQAMALLSAIQKGKCETAFSFTLRSSDTPSSSVIYNAVKIGSETHIFTIDHVGMGKSWFTDLPFTRENVEGHLAQDTNLVRDFWLNTCPNDPVHEEQTLAVTATLDKYDQLDFTVTKVQRNETSTSQGADSQPVYSLQLSNGTTHNMSDGWLIQRLDVQDKCLSAFSFKLTPDTRNNDKSGPASLQTSIPLFIPPTYKFHVLTMKYSRTGNKSILIGDDQSRFRRTWISAGAKALTFDTLAEKLNNFQVNHPQIQDPSADFLKAVWDAMHIMSRCNYVEEIVMTPGPEDASDTPLFFLQKYGLPLETDVLD